MFVMSRLLVLLALLFLVQGCTAIGPTGRSHTAFVEVSGSEVFINGRHASHGARLRPGDRVATGANSSARVRFSDGTVIQLAENTDPDFEWASNAVATGERVLDVTLDFGWMLIESGSDLSVRVFNDLAEVFYHSQGIVGAWPNRFRAYLLRGRLTPLRPALGRLSPNQLLEVTRTGEARIKQFGQREERKIRALFERYDFGQAGPLRVPDLRGLTLKKATAKLNAAGLKRGRVSKVPPGAGERSGRVKKQSRRPNAKVKRGAVVDLVVTQVRQVKQVKVPVLKDKLLEEAVRLLRRRGLKVGQVEGPRRGQRIVVDHSPRAGKQVDSGTAVDLTVEPRYVIQ